MEYIYYILEMIFVGRVVSEYIYISSLAFLGFESVFVWILGRYIYIFTIDEILG